MNLQAEVVTLGETMAVLASPVGVSLRMARSLDLSIAGAESNVAIGLARLGWATAWCGRVGDDELGRLILARLRSENVCTAGAIVDSTAPTGLMLKELRAADLVRVTYYRRDSAGSRFGPTDVPNPLPASARHLHLSGITPALSSSCLHAAYYALTAARAAAMTISFDVNYRSALWPAQQAGPVLRELARRADIVFATRPEAELLLAPDAEISPDTGDEQICRALAALGPAQAILKLGSRGALSVADGDAQAVPAEATTIADQVGAGDAFVTGYLSAYLDRAGVADRLRAAVRTAAFALAATGDWEGLPSRHDLDQWHSAADAVRR